MHITSLAGATILALSVLGSGAAMAQGGGSEDWGTKTCADFLAMDSTAQTQLMDQINTSGGSAMAPGTSGQAGGSMSSDSSAAMSGSMSVGQLTTTCQASPTMTLKDAVGQSGGMSSGSGSQAD